MSKTTLITIIVIVCGIAIAGAAMFSLADKTGNQSSAKGSDFDPQVMQLAECTAYYEISAQTIRRLGVQRMAMVADRLASSAVATKASLVTKIGEQKSSQLIDEQSQQLMAMLPSQDQLGPLMQKYRQPCQQLLLANQS